MTGFAATGGDTGRGGAVAAGVGACMMGGNTTGLAATTGGADGVGGGA